MILHIHLRCMLNRVLYPPGCRVLLIALRTPLEGGVVVILFGGFLVCGVTFMHVKHTR